MGERGPLDSHFPSTGIESPHIGKSGRTLMQNVKKKNFFMILQFSNLFRLQN